MIPEPKIQNDLHRRFSSGAKYILLHLNNYRFSKSNPDKDGPYIHREHLENRLESWLLNSSKSGSYLVSGYRGMGKSSLVDKVIERVTKESNHDLERIWNVAIVAVFVLAVAYIGSNNISWLIGGTAFILVALLISFINHLNIIKNEVGISIFPNGHIFLREKIKKILAHYDKSQQNYKRISVRINLGKEVVNAKDVMCLIATHIRNGYQDYLKTRHNRPLQKCMMTIIVIGGAILITRLLLIPLADYIIYSPNIRTFICRLNDNQPIGSMPINDIEQITVLLFCFATWLVRWFIRTVATSFDKSRVCLARLHYLSEWITSEISEEQSYNIGSSRRNDKLPLFFGIKRSRGRKTNAVTVRDIEAELIDIINTINSKSCLKHNRVQFIIVLDELDKIEQHEDIKDDTDSDIITPPEFTTTVNGFSNNASNNERKNVVLHILGNMKLFLTTAKAKFIFISGREMFDAYLADTSDREYAISSIFSGVINVNSFLYPDREQSDVGSLTEQYLAEVLIPEEYLWQQTLNNARDNNVLKREAASLRWYTQYLTELVDQESLDADERRQRIMEIRHIVTFLHDFIAYLSHVSKGAPKKIVLHLDEYVRRRQDCVKLYDWDDHMEYGKSYYSERKYNAKKPKGVQQDYVLYFTPQDQQKIGFISYLTAPLKNVLINSVSNYNDKLLIEASFLIDHLFKFHGRGFSWRNIEQTPELLDVSKTSDLGDFITSIMEFMQQQHLSPIMVGLYKYKFRKRISEEIAYISRISDEAAALFNFTLNESKPTRQYNIRLLNYYMKLNAQVGSSDKKSVYYDVMSRIHATLADLYFLEENYARALQEYRNSISLLDQLKDDKGQESSTTTITRLRNTLKMALTCEYSKNYETAYAIYCNLVDKMISVREVDERTLGLALVNTWTDDWRIKQPMIVDPMVFESRGYSNMDDKSNVNVQVNVQAQARTDTHGHSQIQRQIQEYPHCKLRIDPRIKSLYEHQVDDLMWEDGINSRYYNNSEYSLNFENLVSGFSKNLSPEKSHFIAKLSLFEDVRLVYKAILAKLFIVEKMNMSGITLSNIETAEAEFKYLHRTTNLKEKFFVSADFFNELGKILYYKNNLNIIYNSYNSLDKENSNESVVENIREALYWCDIDLYAYLDEFCFFIHNCNDPAIKDFDSNEIKKKIISSFDNCYLDKDSWEAAKDLETLFNQIKANLNSKMNIDEKHITNKYTKYIYNPIQQGGKINVKNIQTCHEHRKDMINKGKRTPCHACKYVKRSMNIFMDYMFVNKRDVSLDRLVFLLQNAFYNKLRLTRVNHMRLLASNLASMGNIMFSCADSPIFSFDTIVFVSNMIKSDDNISTPKRECRSKREALIKDFIGNTNFGTIGKLDKALLYYIAAFRFYIIAKLDKDACDCLLKILIIINNALTVAKSNPEYIGKLDNTVAKNNDVLLVNDKSYQKLKVLFNTLFTRYAKLVNRQGAYSELSEFTDIRNILHLHDNEDINLTRSHLYSDLIEAIWHIIDSEIKMLELIKIKDASKDINQKRIKIITDAYNHFKYIGMPHNTFYSEVIFYFARYNINNYILKDILNGSKKKRFEIKFLEDYYDYIKPNGNCSLYDSLYNVSDTKSKQNFIEFLIEDSIICLSEILYILTPFNHISSFSNNFVAGIYNSLWEYAKMYETLGILYDFREYQDTAIFEELFRYWHKIKSSKNKQVQDKIRQCSDLISDAANLRDKYGSLRNRLFTRLKHNIDDRTFKYTISNYAAEMALRYYSLVESGYYEGSAYRNQVSRNYLLNDDLDNDTWLFNTAIERFRINTNDIERRKQTLVKANRNSRFYRYESYVMEKNQETEQFDFFDDIRFEDSLFTNTEL